MIVGVPKEIKLQEHRIGLTPESVKVLVERNHEVLVENNGGLEAGFTNEDYLQAGAKLISTPEEIFETAELIVKVKGSCSSGRESAELSGKSTWTPTVKRGAVTIKIIKRTNITSTNGVTFISLIGSLYDRFNLKAIY